MLHSVKAGRVRFYVQDGTSIVGVDVAKPDNAVFAVNTGDRRACQRDGVRTLWASGGKHAEDVRSMFVWLRLRQRAASFRVVAAIEPPEDLYVAKPIKPLECGDVLLIQHKLVVIVACADAANRVKYEVFHDHNPFKLVYQR